MKKFSKKIPFTVSAMLIGSMAFFAGCKASDGPTAQIEVLPDETVVETFVAAETQPAEPETKAAVKTEKEPEAETIKEPETELLSKEPAETKPEAGKEQEQKETVLAEEGSVEESDFAVIVKGVTIPLGGDMSNYEASLGEPDDFSSAKSCTEAGDDKVYTYGGTVIYTYVTNGADIISIIEITGSETLVSGLHIGSTKEEAIAAYGSAYTEEGAEWLYEMGNKTIGLQMANDKVAFIELFGQ